MSRGRQNIREAILAADEDELSQNGRKISLANVGQKKLRE